MIRLTEKISDTEKKEVVYRMYAGYKKDFPEVKDMSPQQAIELLDQGKVVFVDTRMPSEMAVSMIPGAVTKQELLSQTERYKDKTIHFKLSIIVGRSGLQPRFSADVKPS